MTTTKTDVAAIEAALTLISNLTEKDLIAIQKAHKHPEKAPPNPTRRATDVPLPTIEAIKAKKNAQQKAYRSTPEGRAAANEASKKSHAAAKAREKAAKAFLAEKVALQRLLVSATVIPTTTKR